MAQQLMEIEEWELRRPVCTISQLFPSVIDNIWCLSLR